VHFVRLSTTQLKGEESAWDNPPVCATATAYLVSHADVSVRMQEGAAEVSTQDDEHNGQLDESKYVHRPHVVCQPHNILTPLHGVHTLQPVLQPVGWTMQMSAAKRRLSGPVRTLTTSLGGCVDSRRRGAFDRFFKRTLIYLFIFNIASIWSWRMTTIRSITKLQNSTVFSYLLWVFKTFRSSNFCPKNLHNHRFPWFLQRCACIVPPLLRLFLSLYDLILMLKKNFCFVDGFGFIASLFVMGLLQLRYEHDSSTIRLRFGYNTLQHATRFFMRSHTRSYTRISGRRVLHVDWQLNAHSFYCILI